MAPRGYNVFSDIVRTTTDGQDLNTIWQEFAAALVIQNDAREALSSLFTYQTTAASEEVMQDAGDEDDFEEASEFGVPKSLRNAPSTTKVGYPLKWYDAASRFTSAFLRDAPAAQVEGVHARALEADNRLVFKGIMNALLTQTTAATRKTNEDGTVIYSLWDGEPDSVPPTYAGTVFDPGHNHYLTSQSLTLDGDDLLDLIRHITHHGFGTPQGDRILILLNPDQADDVQGLRVSGGSPFDFIPAAGGPAYLTQETLVGDRPPASYNGMTVLGSFGEAWICENYLVPSGYAIALASAGPNNGRNPLAMREHPRPEYRGLRQIPGGRDAFPLIDSYYSRGFGVGVSHRSAACIMQVTTNLTYTSPAL